MLNELSQAADAIEKLGVAPQSRHGRITPMGKNRELLIVCVSEDGRPSRVEIMDKQSASSFSCGARFGGIEFSRFQSAHASVVQGAGW